MTALIGSSFMDFLGLKKLLINLILPQECVVCEDQDEILCQDCFSNLKYLKNQGCINCGKNSVFGEICPECRPNFYFDGLISAGSYQDKNLQKIIKAWKYYFIRDLEDYLFNFLLLFLAQILSKKENEKNCPEIFLKFNQALIIPIPLYKKRKNWRGFNQSEALASKISAYFDLEICLDKLKRVKYHKPQAKLNKKARQKNIENNFSWEGGDLAGKNIFLVDDIASTGATLNEAAWVLKENNAGLIYGLVLAHG